MAYGLANPFDRAWNNVNQNARAVARTVHAPVKKVAKAASRPWSVKRIKVHKITRRQKACKKCRAKCG